MSGDIYNTPRLCFLTCPIFHIQKQTECTYLIKRSFADQLSFDTEKEKTNAKKFKERKPADPHTFPVGKTEITENL